MKEMTFNSNTVGGVAYIYAIPLSAVTAIVKNHVTGLHSITMSMDDVIKLDCYYDETFSFGETHGRDDHGDYWDVNITAVVPKACFDNATTVELLERGEWLVVTKDHNGMLRLSGDAETQLTCASDASSGTTYVDHNHTVLTFTGRLGHPSWLITDDL